MKFLLLLCAIGAASCAPLSAEHIEALSRDNASVCLSSAARGGAGGIIGGATGGYGQAELVLCRSNRPNARLSIAKDGTVSIENGE